MKELGVTLSKEDVNDMFTEVGCQHTRRITYAGEKPTECFAEITFVQVVKYILRFSAALICVVRTIVPSVLRFI